jgi:hypothetical protein
MSELDLSIDNIGIETIYYLLKQKNKDCKKKNEIQLEQNALIQNNFCLSKEEINKELKYIPFNEKSNWNYSTFSTNINNHNLEYPEILSNSWTPTCLNIDNGIEISNKIFECEETINYDIVNTTIKANIVLKGDGMFWIFLRVNHEFDDKTIAIVFSKKEYSQRVSMSLGSFVKLDYIKKSNEIGNNFFIFQKQQLIKDYNINNNKKEKDNYEAQDSCLIKMTIIDEGFDKIKINAKLNDGEIDNQLIGQFYNQVVNIQNLELNNTINNTINNENNYRVMIAGNGSYCKINNFYCETKLKRYIDNNKIEMGEGCDCCKII